MSCFCPTQTLIAEFWRSDEAHSFSGTETRLFFYLIKVASSNLERNAQELRTITLSDRRAAAIVGVALNTLKKARLRLQEAKLFDFEPGGHGNADKSTYTFRYQPLTPTLIPIVTPTLTPSEPRYIDTKKQTSLRHGNHHGNHGCEEDFVHQSPVQESATLESPPPTITPPSVEDIKQHAIAALHCLPAIAESLANLFEVHWKARAWVDEKSGNSILPYWHDRLRGYWNIARFNLEADYKKLNRQITLDERYAERQNLNPASNRNGNAPQHRSARPQRHEFNLNECLAQEQRMLQRMAERHGCTVEELCADDDAGKMGIAGVLGIGSRAEHRHA